MTKLAVQYQGIVTTCWTCSLAPTPLTHTGRTLHTVDPSQYWTTSGRGGQAEPLWPQTLLESVWPASVLELAARLSWTRFPTTPWGTRPSKTKRSRTHKPPSQLHWCPCQSRLGLTHAEASHPEPADLACSLPPDPSAIHLYSLQQSAALCSICAH